MPSAILTATQFDAYLVGDLLTKASTEQAVAALDRACSEADGYLRAGGYATPVTNADATPDLQGRVADLARYHLATVLRLLPEPAEKSALYLGYRAAQAWFKDVAAGSVSLDLAVEETGDTPGAPVIATNTRRGWERGW